jgi:hypothetical protein
MECICLEKCLTTTSVRGKVRPRFFYPGAVRTFDECPPHWSPLESTDFDFMTASEEELLARGDWEIEELIEFVKETYDVTLRRGMRRDTYVEKLMDARYRHLEQMTNAE